MNSSPASLMSLPHYSAKASLSHRYSSAAPTVYANYSAQQQPSKAFSRLCGDEPNTVGFAGATYTPALNILA